MSNIIGNLAGAENQSTSIDQKIEEKSALKPKPLQIEKTNVAHSETPSEEDSFTEHDSVDSDDELNVKSRNEEDADKARAFYTTLERYKSVVIP